MIKWDLCLGHVNNDFCILSESESELESESESESEQCGTFCILSESEE